MSENETNFVILILGACLLLFFIAVFIVKFIVRVYVPFLDERDFILMEIDRTHGDERIHWKHELKRLYISQIPFIGETLAENSRKRSRERRNNSCNQKIHR